MPSSSQLATPNTLLDSKEYLARKRERQVFRSCKPGTRKSFKLRHRKRQGDVKPIPTPSPTPRTPACMPRERMTPPPAPRPSRNRVVDLGTPTPPPRRSRDEFPSLGLLFHARGSSSAEEDVSDDEPDAWFGNMRDAFEGANRTRKVKPN